MADSTTPNYGLILPTVNDPAGEDLWGEKTNTNWGTVDTTLKSIADSVTPKASVTYVDAQNAAQDTVIAGKAPLASPTFTGDPKAPTAAASDNDTSIATTAFVHAAFAADAAAAGYATTAYVDTGLAGKADTVHTHIIADVTSLQATLDAKLALAGGTMLGLLTLSGAPTVALHAATKAYADSVATAGGPGKRVNKITVIDSGSGTHTFDANTTSWMVEGVGGGGGGGGTGNANASEAVAAWGGGGAGYFRHYETTDMTAKAYAVGAAGAGNSSAAGSAGGTTSFGSLSATGGGGGGLGTSAGSAGPQVAGLPSVGVGSGGNQANANGGTSDFTWRLTGLGISGSGGHSAMGPGAPRQINNTSGTSVAGNDATSPGAGGGGSANCNRTSGAAVRGGNGGAGKLVITEFRGT